MENIVSKYTNSFGLSVALCSVINALLVVAKEKSHAISGWLQKVTGYQWVTHVVILLILFALSGYLFSCANGRKGPKISAHRLVGTIVAGVVMGCLIITGFYLIAD